MIELNVRDLRKQALIRFSLKPEGHIFAVRKQTPGDDLALSEIARKKSKMLIEASELQEQINAIKSDDTNRESKIDKADKDIDAIIKKLSKLDDEELSVKARVFDDGGDNALSLALYRDLSDDERTALIDAVLNGTSIGADNGDAA